VNDRDLTGCRHAAAAGLARSGRPQPFGSSERDDVIVADSTPAKQGPAGIQPVEVPPSKPFGMAESFFSAVKSSFALVVFHSTESPAFV
jgi:hypothetical protein